MKVEHRRITRKKNITFKKVFSPNSFLSLAVDFNYILQNNHATIETRL